MRDLFDNDGVQTLAEGLVLLRRYTSAQALLPLLQSIIAAAPLRHLVTPGGHTMSVAMTNCGHYGWVSDRRGYRYSATDPQSGAAWPVMPPALETLACRAAEAAGFSHYQTDVALINRYAPGNKLSLHQDHDECDRTQPIVSVSLGVNGVFQIGNTRERKARYTLDLHDGDIVVFGGASRMIYHGIKPLAAASHPVTGACRFNITFRYTGLG